MRWLQSGSLIARLRHRDESPSLCCRFFNDSCPYIRKKEWWKDRGQTIALYTHIYVYTICIYKYLDVKRGERESSGEKNARGSRRILCWSINWFNQVTITNDRGPDSFNRFSLRVVFVCRISPYLDGEGGTKTRRPGLGWKTGNKTPSRAVGITCAHHLL